MSQAKVCNCSCHVGIGRFCQPPCCDDADLLYSEMDNAQKIPDVGEEVLSFGTYARQLIRPPEKEPAPYSAAPFKAWNEHRSRV
ncbi:MAG: hypothetical protein WCO55_02695 [Candidatus Falkowbacteria bacterium]